MENTQSLFKAGLPMKQSINNYTMADKAVFAPLHVRSQRSDLYMLETGGKPSELHMGSVSLSKASGNSYELANQTNVTVSSKLPNQQQS